MHTQEAWSQSSEKQSYYLLGKVSHISREQADDEQEFQFTDSGSKTWVDGSRKSRRKRRPLGKMPYTGRRHDRSHSTSENSSVINSSSIVQIDVNEEILTTRQQNSVSSSLSLSAYNIDRHNAISQPGCSRMNSLRSSPSEILPYPESPRSKQTRMNEHLCQKANSERLLTKSISSMSEDRRVMTDKAIGASSLTVQEIMDMEHHSDNNDQKCRYCFGSADGWIVKQSLISPCKCSGSMAYVHKSCLEKWLTVRDANECDLCRFSFKTDFVYKPIKEWVFPSMPAEEICLIAVTTTIYITFIFQFLAAAYIGMVAEQIPISVLGVSLAGLTLGLVWFLVGCITLTVVTYTSDYWHEWRQINKRRRICLKSSYRRLARDTLEQNNCNMIPRFESVREELRRELRQELAMNV